MDGKKEKRDGESVEKIPTIFISYLMRRFNVCAVSARVFVYKRGHACVRIRIYFGVRLYFALYLSLNPSMYYGHSRSTFPSWSGLCNHSFSMYCCRVHGAFAYVFKVPTALIHTETWNKYTRTASCRNCCFHLEQTVLINYVAH